jgi:hypothetical protein
MNSFTSIIGKSKASILGVLLATLIVVPTLGGCTEQQENTDTTADETTAQVSENLPEQPFTVPGWLGFATKEQSEGASEYPFSPTNPEAEIAVFSDEWSEVESGTTLIALAPGVKEDVTFRRSAQEPYGCDDTPTAMATFSAPQPLPEGAVWLLPPSQADAATAVSLEELPLDEVPETLLALDKRVPLSAKAWQAGEMTLLLERIGEDTVRLKIAQDSEEIYNTEAEILSMEAAYEEPVDLSAPFQPGIPQPVGAFQFSENAVPLIVLWTPSFEGHNFQVLVPSSGTLAPIDAAYVYYCAF